MNLLEKYLRELRDIRSTGSAAKETSYYPALVGLLNEVGKTLKPKVRCVLTPKNLGAGVPDIGLFVSRQRFDESEAFINLAPERGVLEVKGAKAEVAKIAQSDQVEKYLQRYGQVLVTNYRDFLLVSKDAGALEAYRLAESEAAFWQAAANPNESLAIHGERFVEYLKRVLLSNAPLEAPADVAWFLASYARDARGRVEIAGQVALDSIRKALEEALGIQFTGERGEHFFRSTLVQTLFYGVFSAWVLWHKQTKKRNGHFDWRLASHYLRVPILRKLFHEVSEPGQLERLDLTEVLDWTAAALNRVRREIFFSRFEEEHAVQYFYEPFLEAFDPDLRKQLGVWYTPTEIVQYMVARVDTVLREELKLADGLADPNVYVLDPCCGTGAYLVEVLKQIDRTLKERGEEALAAEELKRAAINRVFGFEILPAPFVVAHLQMGLLLQSLGAPMGANERAGVYLTNALTGWEPPKEPKTRLLFTELEEERDAAEKVKRDTPILVVLGNPPYNAFAGVSPVEEQGIVEPYKEGLISKWGIKKFNLDDLYVRFFRLAERRIAEKTGKGVVCYISNFSYLGDPSYVVMRQRFLSEFDALWFDCLNGDSRETGKLTPDGEPDPSVFSTDYNREGIRIGTTVGLMVRKEKRATQPTVRFREFWGINKRAELVASLNSQQINADYELVSPEEGGRLSFRPSSVSTQYKSWPTLVSLCRETPISGLQEMRRGALMNIAREKLEERMRSYFDQDIDWEIFDSLKIGLAEDGGRFVAKSEREKLQKSEKFEPTNIRPYALYPFDLRWCYHSTTRPLWNEPRPALAKQGWSGNQFIVTRMFAERPNEQNVITITSALPDYHLLRPNAVAIPIRLRATSAKRGNRQQQSFLSEENAEEVRANLSEIARTYLNSIGLTDLDANAETAALVWVHALAIGYSPAYLAENADGIRQDWPRIPLPASKDLLLASAELGRKVAALLDTETAVAGVTSGSIRAELKVIGVAATADGKRLNREAGDFDVTAGWGHGGQRGITMPGKGRMIPRDYTATERAAIEQGARELGLPPELTFAHLGEETCDVYLNGNAYWRGAPLKVWEYTIGGYQVMKKWLSYRERELLGRALTLDEVREVTNMARRIAAILLLEPALDEN
ncbi:MAG: type ISP restriction/modification enzyme, partial [Blastocatellia bacterium]